MKFYKLDRGCSEPIVYRLELDRTFRPVNLEQEEARQLYGMLAAYLETERKPMGKDAAGAADYEPLRKALAEMADAVRAATERLAEPLQDFVDTVRGVTDTIAEQSFEEAFSKPLRDLFRNLAEIVQESESGSLSELRECVAAPPTEYEIRVEALKAATALYAGTQKVMTATDCAKHFEIFLRTGETP